MWPGSPRVQRLPQALAQKKSNMYGRSDLRMRNVFDQYNQPENRLTHALAVCLDEDRLLLRDFLSSVGVTAVVSARDLVVVEQSLPGDPPASADEAERSGLPDIVIQDVRLPWDTPGLSSREALRLIAGGWRALEPLLDVLCGKSGGAHEGFVAPA